MSYTRLGYSSVADIGWTFEQDVWSLVCSGLKSTCAIYVQCGLSECVEPI